MQLSKALATSLHCAVYGAVLSLFAPTLQQTATAGGIPTSANVNRIASGLNASKTPGSPAPAQKTFKIVGVVTDSKTGDPLVGATIKLLGTSVGAVTDVDGRFEIQAAKGSTLEVSYLGYTTKKIKVSDVKVLSITLSDDVQTLEGAVITAFGTTQKKETVTGSIQTVRPADFRVLLPISAAANRATTEPISSYAAYPQ